MNNEIIFRHGDIAILDEIKELWEELNKHHLEKSPYFKHHFENYTFEKRKESIIKEAKNGKILVIIAYDNNKKIGYIVSSVKTNIGEIESIYIKEDYRKCHIGNILMEKSLDFLKSNDVKKIIIGVSYGNEEAFGFYEKFGFYPKVTVLQFISNV